jgi:hypothetical protein
VNYFRITMEADSGYHTSEEWYPEYDQHIYEAEPVYYSDSDSAYSDTEINTPDIQLGEEEEDMEVVEEENNEGAFEELLEEEEPMEEAEHNGHIMDPPAHEAMGIPVQNEEDQQENRDETEGLEEIDMNLYLQASRTPFNEAELFEELERLERELERDRAIVRTEEEAVGFQMGPAIPEEYRWEEFDETCLAIGDMDLGARMREIRTRRGPIDIKEIHKLHTDIEVAKVRQKLEIEKGNLIENLKAAEKKAENLFSALRMAIHDKEIALSIGRQLKTEMITKDEELKIGKEMNYRKYVIISEWKTLCEDKERELAQVREENKDLRTEISDLRMALCEMKIKTKTKE